MFTEKLLRFRNSTAEKLSLDISYFGNVEGKSQWKKLKVLIEPKAQLVVMDPDGLRVAASQITFAATGKDVYFGAHATHALWLVEENSQHQRTYKAEKMEEFVEEFRSHPVAGSGSDHAGTGAPNPVRK